MMKRSRLKRGSNRLKDSRMRKVGTAMIGDGKTPNKYWVMVSSDYYIEDPKEGALNWASDVKGMKVQSKLVKKFDTYEEAKAYADGIPLESKVNGVEANSVHIEDRLSGQVYERSIGGHRFEDIEFTREEEAKRGVKSSLRVPEDKAKEVNASNLVDYVMAYEGGSISKEDYLRLMAYLIKTGQAWSLQGSIYGRPAHDLIEAGIISKEGKINWEKVDEE